MQNKLKEYAKLVGNTPLVEVEYLYKNKKSKSYFKLEYFNPSGSIKDRMALEIMQNAVKNNEFKAGMSIAEATSGNTGIAFSALGAFIGASVEIFMPCWMSEERKKIIKSYGAKLREVSACEGGFSGSVRLADESAKNGNVFLPHQFENESNVKAHEKTANEILNTLKKHNLKPDCFVAGVGTGGTIMGIGKVLRPLGVKICPLEPEGCASMSNPGENSEHRIQGIGDGFVPDIVKLNELDDIIIVNDIDSVIMAQKLAKIGLGVGISSGANFLGCIKAKELFGDCVSVSVFADDNKKYLSTDLMLNMQDEERFLSNKIELIGFKVL
ncbi:MULTISPECIES: cysteine synthase family protein [unclassified Campylobacter]|nr:MULTISPECIES: cysteine synthase family protein [unclassified Campylobacter]MBT0879712.1 cysteine synthase family protein [Campylobacter sp. 2018MI27]MBT0884630.1 cysteine synthase family protein [Campylobacter sp. 2018MI10]